MTPKVSVLMGSDSDWPIMSKTVAQLHAFDVPHEARVISAHRALDLLTDYVRAITDQGVKCFIAGAGGAAHLPGVVAALTTLPVLGVPMPSKHLQGHDSLLSIVQMPKGIPVATFAIGEAGAANAGLFAVALLAVEDAALAKKLAAFRLAQREKIINTKLPPA